MLRDALAASPTPQPTKHVLLAPGHLPPLLRSLEPFCRDLGDQGAQNYPGVTAAHPKVEFPFASRSGTVEGWQGAPALRMQPGCAVDFWMDLG